MVGSSPALAQLRALVLRVSRSDCPVLIHGETGVGKELVARSIHDQGGRAAEPFLAVNCATIPRELAESLLFGHERGAFTGADRQVAGYFEAAQGGTVLLDEVGDAPAHLQAKLLRTLEERTFRRVGGHSNMTVQARVLTASHVELEPAVRAGRFRADLFHRLNVIRIVVPPLRERREDIPELVHWFARAQVRSLSFTREALKLLSDYDWPGNVRELRNTITRICVLSDASVVTRDIVRALLEPRDQAEPGRGTDQALTATQDLADWPRQLLRFSNHSNKLRLAERELIREAMRECGCNKSAAARLLGIERKALDRRLRKLGVASSLRLRHGHSRSTDER